MQRAIVVAELVADGVVVLKRGAAKLVEGYRAWSARRRAYGELMGLDDRMLADLGIARGEIQSVVYGEGLAETPRAVNDNRADAGRPIAA
ncbi:MAG: DUF1127 domain-containing protein [Alphaproteobacteria bacterium]|nr:DUF1127 domain-containing protein [Alphaproteobacteria bacterium]